MVEKRPVGVGAVAAEGQCDRGKDTLGRGLRCAKEPDFALEADRGIS